MVRELGLDRYPELRDDYFRHYTRVVWLAQEPDDPELRALAEQAAERLGLPLTVVPTGDGRLEQALADLLASVVEEVAPATVAKPGDGTCPVVERCVSLTDDRVYADACCASSSTNGCQASTAGGPGGRGARRRSRRPG